MSQGCFSTRRESKGGKPENIGDRHGPYYLNKYSLDPSKAGKPENTGSVYDPYYLEPSKGGKPEDIGGSSDKYDRCGSYNKRSGPYDKYSSDALGRYGPYDLDPPEGGKP